MAAWKMATPRWWTAAVAAHTVDLEDAFSSSERLPRSLKLSGTIFFNDKCEWVGDQTLKYGIFWRKVKVQAESRANGENSIYEYQFSLYFSIYVNTGCGLNSSDQDSPEESPIAGNSFTAIREPTGSPQVRKC